MSSQPSNFRRTDVKRAVQAMRGTGLKVTVTKDSELYFVRNAVWKAAGMQPDGGCLCVECLERRIGRRLKPKDFDSNHSFNQPDLPCTYRLRDRREGWETAR